MPKFRDRHAKSGTGAARGQTERRTSFVLAKQLLDVLTLKPDEFGRMMIPQSKTTNPAGSGRGVGGFAFIELLVIVGITVVLLIGVAGFALFSGRSFAAIFNYVDLDDANRVAMEQLAKDLRQAKRVTGFGANYLYLEDADKEPLKYDYNAADRTLSRSKGGVTKTVLSECDTLKFDICQRNALAGSYEIYSGGSSNDSAKVIDVSWVCSRTIFGKNENGETIPPTRMFFRKQGS